MDALQILEQLEHTSTIASISLLRIDFKAYKITQLALIF